jgi:TRAP-type transport system periplasmic protein
MKSKKMTILISLALLLILSTSFNACSQSSTPSSSPALPVTTAATPATTSAAQPTVIKLTFGGLYTDPHPEYLADQAWMEKVKKETNGRVDFQYFPASTVVTAQNSFEELQKGVVDISYIYPNPQTPGLLFQDASTVWLYGVPKYEDRMRIFLDMCAKYQQIPAEYNKAKMLGISPGNNYQLITRRPVRTVEDVKGLAMRAMGSHGDWFKEMGGSGVAMPMGETYLALQKGTVDGAFAPMETMKTFKFGEVAKYITILNVTSTPYFCRAINWDKYNKLPADIQKILDNNLEFITMQTGANFVANDLKGETAAKEAGVEFITPPPAEVDRFFAALKTVCLKKAVELDGKGYKGTDMFNEIRNLAQKYVK